jgi:hypothetical protein
VVGGIVTDFIFWVAVGGLILLVATLAVTK